MGFLVVEIFENYRMLKQSSSDPNRLNKESRSINRSTNNNEIFGKVCVQPQSNSYVNKYYSLFLEIDEIEARPE